MQNNDPVDSITSSTVEPVIEPSAAKARGSFDLRGSRSNKPKPVKLWAGIALVVIIFCIALVAIWTYAIGEMTQGSAAVNETQVVADATLAAQPAADRGMAEYRAEKLRQMEEEQKRKEAEEAKKADESEPVQGPNKASSAPPRGPAGSAPTQPAQPAVMTSKQRKLSSGVMMPAVINSVAGLATGVGGAPAENGGQPTTNVPGALPRGIGDPAPLLGNSGAGGGSSSRGSLNDLGGVDFEPTQASLAPSGKYLLAHGTYARCALYPEIITEQPGIIDCRLTEPLYSADGSTVIAEASSRLTGVQKVAMVAGQQNVFTAWNELETTAGVRARLDSLGAGPMGASGTKAWIDNHYAQRYGGAVALSFMQDLLKAATTRKQGSDSGGYTVNNSEQNVESMADKALNSTINTPPTGYILPGTVITVIIARDIDFSSVFENR